jgi:hypothetical protein
MVQKSHEFRGSISCSRGDFLSKVILTTGCELAWAPTKVLGQALCNRRL